MATMATSTHLPQTKGEEPAFWLSLYFHPVILHVVLLMCIQQVRVYTKGYKENIIIYLLCTQRHFVESLVESDEALNK